MVSFFVAAGVQADITLSAHAPPQADELAVRVSRGKQATILLRGHQGGGGSLTFRIVQRPDHGKLSQLRLIGDNRAEIAYQNDGVESVTSDRFRYVVKSNDGRSSSPAEVSITVEDVPAKLVVPAKIEFGEIQAGESESRSFAIANAGGGVLEGRLSVSAPWQLSSTGYRMTSGRTENISVRFEPDEGRQFVGQITLTGLDGNETAVQLSGTATSPVLAEPDHLDFQAKSEENGSRVGSVALTNRTERVVTLELDAGPKIEPIPEITLQAHERKEVSIGLRRDWSTALDEDIAFVATGFKVRVHVIAAARLSTPMGSSTNAISAQGSSTAPPSATSANERRSHTAPFTAITPPVVTAALPGTTARSDAAVIAVKVKRLGVSRWELRWPQPKAPITKYRLEERLVSLDNAGRLQANWKEITPIEARALGKEVVAEIAGLDSKQRHMVRVTAIGGSGTTSWESPVVPLMSLESPRSKSPLLLLLGIALGVFLFLRWRSNLVVA